MQPAGALQAASTQTVSQYYPINPLLGGGVSRHVCKLLLFLQAIAQIRAFSVLQLSPPAHQNRPETLTESSTWLLWSDGARTHDSVWACGREQSDNVGDIINTCKTTWLH